MDEHSETLIELNAKLERLLSGIEALSVNQERMGEDISKIKEAVYNPDEGLYARLRALEQWKDTTSRLQWMIISSILVLMGKLFWDVVVMGGN
jgi:adenylosuccinate lyase